MVFKICDSSVCRSIAKLGAIYVEETAIGALSKINSRVVIWNLLKHCREVDGEKGKSKYVPFLQFPCDGEGVRKAHLMLDTASFIHVEFG